MSTEPNTPLKSKKESKYVHKQNQKYLFKLKRRFESYCMQAPIISFHSAKYDLNLIKKTIAQNLKLHDSKHTFTVKRNNIYIVHSNKRVKFLNISIFLAPGTVTESMILKAVECGELFGMLEVDIEVPKSWKSSHKSKSELDPTTYFSEMSPLFCTTEIPFNVIGSHMLEHAQKCSLSEKPRTLLVGGMRAQKIIIATPLLKSYIDHEMHI